MDDIDRGIRASSSCSALPQRISLIGSSSERGPPNSANVPEGSAESEVRDGERGSGRLAGYEVTSGMRSQVGAW